MTAIQGGAWWGGTLSASLSKASFSFFSAFMFNRGDVGVGDTSFL